MKCAHVCMCAHAHTHTPTPVHHAYGVGWSPSQKIRSLERMNVTLFGITVFAGVIKLRALN